MKFQEEKKDVEKSRGQLNENTASSQLGGN